jgi:endo-1,4-beta-D-glucanase Y
MQQRTSPRPRRGSVFLFSAGLAATFAAGCAGGGSSGGGGTGSPGTGGHGTVGTGGGTGSQGTGGGIGNPGTGGGVVLPGTGGNTNAPGTGGGNIGPGSGGNGAPGSGGNGAPGTGGGSVGGAGAGRACAVASPDVVSDFEEGSGVMVKQGTPQRNGWWYVYAPTPMPAGSTQTPAMSPTAVAVEPSGDTAACNKYALHSTGKGFNVPATGDYAGFGAGFLPMPAPSMLKTAYDLSAYTGISFKIKSGAGTPPAVFFEVLTKDSQPAPSGGTATVPTIDLYNTRGQILNAPFSTGITQAWQTITVPFGTLVPRWLPAVGATMACPAGAAGAPKCQSPRFNPANVLGIQFSMYADKGFPRPGGSVPGTYDLWVDDVTLVKGDLGLPTRPGFPNDAAVGTCVKPTGAAGKYLVHAYDLWKAQFVVPGSPGFRVQRPEAGNDTVSEGIAYGMLIAVYMNDQPLFDGLWAYWKSKADGSAPDGPLMVWNTTGGVGSATDADEDAAFAMLQASKKWPGGTYGSSAMDLMHAVLAHDMSGTFIKGGSMYTAGQPTNPSYFAPAYYRVFATADTGNAAAWNGLASGAYSLLASISGASGSGLFPAWCGNNCTASATNTGSANPSIDVIYQYDAHRIPWRIGMDYCWNGTVAAKPILAKLSGFFQTQSANGIGRIADLYTLGGAPFGNAMTMSAPNSSSIIGTAAAGAMSDPAYQTFLNDGYQFVLDLLNRGTLDDPQDGTKSSYSYYNATVGMLTLLTMTGNLHPL